MAYIYLNFSKGTPKTPWAVTVTNSDRTELFSQELAAELEVNVPCKTFTGKFHYFYCEGEVTWQGTKAVINPVK
jgi:hypothetical protein